MEAEQILRQAAQASASDIFIVAGLPVSYKVNNPVSYTHLTLPTILLV